MKGYILDTDTWIEFFHQRGKIAAHIADTPVNQIFASEISIAELTYGAFHSKDVDKHLKEPKMIEETFTVLPVRNWIQDYAEIRNSLTNQGLQVGDFDILIGVCARCHGLTVVTHNTRHFSKMPDVKCIDWMVD